MSASPAGPARLGRRRRQMALIVTLIALATFVSPLIETDSEIIGRTRWSAFEVVLALHSGSLPIRHMMKPDLVFLGLDALFGFGVVYFLLSSIAIAILFFPYSRFVGYTSAIGFAWVWGDAKYGYFDLQDAIYGAPSAFSLGHRVHARIYCLILFGLLGLLVFIAATEQLD